MWSPGMGQTLTVLLRAWSDGDRGALDQLMPIVYEELRRIAQHHMRGQPAGITLRPTELVAEAFLRLADKDSSFINDRVHFFALASRAMRQILVDHARERA